MRTVFGGMCIFLVGSCLLTALHSKDFKMWKLQGLHLKQKIIKKVIYFISGPPSLSTVSDQLAHNERTSSSTTKQLSTQTPNQLVGNRSSTNSSEHIDRKHVQASGVSTNASLNHKAKYIESSRNSLDSQSSTSNSEEMKDEPLTFFTAAKFR